MKCSSSIDARALSGVFRIRAERRGDRTYLAGREISKPFHLSKPYWTGRVLLVQAVNATAGVFAGDYLETAAEIETGAAVFLTTPSATRLYSMPEGTATASQSFRIARGGWLESRPEWIIPQKACSFIQRTRIEWESGARFIYWEALAPGRVARGERFAYNHLAWELDLLAEGRRILRERVQLTPNNHALWSLQHPFDAAYYAAVYLVWDDPAAIEPLQGDIHGWKDTDSLIGGTLLDNCCWVFKILAQDALALRRTLARLRSTLSTVVPYLAEPDRKL
ncbi:MAG: urease accessory protein UreD [Kiritimatiellae bacterium]|nr:urease accessory protein UreD [Kiritimatiellia bacterium]MDW8459356.1 urease accessory protein UreD [Verrucomicrobiota bacterium]